MDTPKPSDTIHKTAIPCDCGCEAVLIWEFDQWGDEPHHVMVDLIVGYYAASLRARVKAAWRVLRGKDPWLHSMCFQDEAVGQIHGAFAPILASADSESREDADG